MKRRCIYGLAAAATVLTASLMGVQTGLAIASEADTMPVDKVRANKHPKPEGWVASDQAAAVEFSRRSQPFVEDVLMEDLLLRQQRLRRIGLGTKDIEHSYLWLESPFVNTFENIYGPVRFMHSRHAAALGGDCAACHHYRPADTKAPETVACNACHQEAFNPEHHGRIGLKAAYHMQCMGCHEDVEKGPVACEGCHAKNVPDHEKLVTLPPDPTPMQVTQECLRCHDDAGRDMLASAHWLWRGPSRYTVEHRSNVGCGKGTLAFNNY
ncbi:MAG: cytochrome c family protein [Thermoanaerobaculales bacterium]|jgi:hypothetical protein|nr:cytochrome c family protein [Thermoanaerobaculales bacterium]